MITGGISLPSRFVARLKNIQADALIVILCAGFIGFLVNAFEPFGLEDDFDSSVSRAGNSIMAPLYGWVGGRVGQRDIMIVVIQEDTLAAFQDDTWPLPYRSQALLAQLIAERKPAALFLDFYYARYHDKPVEVDFWGDGDASPAGPATETGLESLARTLTTISQDFPVMIGPVVPATKQDKTGLQPLVDRISASSNGSLMSVGVEHSGPPFYYYPMRDAGQRRQAAVELRNVWCKRQKSDCADFPEYEDDARLAVDWGFGTTPLMARYQPVKERALCGSGSFWMSVKAFARIVLHNLTRVLNDDDLRVYESCPYFDTIPAEWLVTPPPGLDLDELIKDRLVLVGVDLPYLSDYVPAPLYGPVPGVTLHAMALDNLITSGVAATKPAPVVWLGIDAADVWEMMIAFLSLIVLILFFTTPREESWVRRFLAFVHRSAVMFVLSICAALFASAVFHWPFVNFVAISGAGIAGFFVYRDIVQDGSDAAAVGQTAIRRNSNHD